MIHSTTIKYPTPTQIKREQEDLKQQRLATLSPHIGIKAVNPKERR